MNVLAVVVKGFGSIERAYYMGLNDYFCPRISNRPHATPNYGPLKYKYKVDYDRQTYRSPEKVSRNPKKIKKSRSDLLF